jgi:hypothetical protein
VVTGILGLTYYVARPPLDGRAGGDVDRGDYAALDQLGK